MYDVNGDSQNDIAILKLEKSAPINKKIQVACLPKSQSTEFPSANIDSWAVGWGILDFMIVIFFKYEMNDKMIERHN